MSGYRRLGRNRKRVLAHRRQMFEPQLRDQRAAFRADRRQQRITRRGGR